MPIWDFAETLQHKCMLNRVTLIVGSTGCGKSTQVPQILQRGLAGKILCSQPRRLAVVAIAARVAEECGAVLGEEVGFQIGQKRAVRESTTLEFCTAGILLERLKVNGEAALAEYKVLIVDEVHERSPESDLMLASVRAFMMGGGGGGGRSATGATQLHLVLMSATVDLDRYKEYFKPVLGATELGSVDTVNVDQVARPDSAGRGRLWQTRVRYLEHIRLALEQQQEGRPGGPLRGRNVGGVDSYTIFHLIEHLVSRKGEEGEGGTILVFLPTYRHLEEQFRMLAHLGLPTHILHSSIDIEDCMRSLQRDDEGSSARPGRWKIVLATNIAESSVTIHGVSHVIDSCLTNAIELDLATRSERQGLVKVSQSQADQRKGRTGRTCNGTVWRMCTRRQFEAFEKFEAPALQLRSLEPQALILLSSASRVMSHAEKLFSATLDAPDSERVALALGTLTAMGAATVVPTRGGKSRHAVTSFGRLLADMPVSIRSAKLAIAGAMVGVMRESAVCAAVLSCTPQPILRPFNQFSNHIANLRRFTCEGGSCDEEDEDDAGADLTDADKIVSQYLAYAFWQSQYIRPKLLAAAREEEFMPLACDREEEEAWCEYFGLCRSALHDVHETATVIVNVFHRIRPQFLHASSSLPLYVRCGNNGFFSQEMPASAETAQEGHSSTPAFCRTLWAASQDGVGTPFHRGGKPAKETVLQLVQTALLPMCAMPTPCDEEEHSEEQDEGAYYGGGARQRKQKKEKKKVCIFFRQGRCTRGAACKFAHTMGAAGSATRPLCKFYSTHKGCRFGASCSFSHGEAREDEEARAAQREGLSEQIQADITVLNASSGESGGGGKGDEDAPRLELCHGETIVLVGEGDFAYALHLASLFEAVDCDLVATGLDTQDEIYETYASAERTLQRLREHEARSPALCLQLGFSLNACDPGSGETLDLFSRADKIVWNFPFAGADGDGESNTYLMQRFFHCCFSSRSASYARDDMRHFPPPQLEVYVTLCNDQFVRWGLMQVAEAAFFFLRTSFAFKLDGLGGYEPRRNFTEGTFSAERATTYVFAMQPAY